MPPQPQSRRVKGAPGFYLNKIPGYTEALHRARKQEFRTREDNWLALSGTIAGQTVRVMTVRDYVALLRVRNPFLARQEPSFADLGQFLWLLSPEIERWHNHTGWRKPWLVGCRWKLFSIEHWQIRFHSKGLRRRLKMRQLENTAREWNRANPGKLYDIPEAHGLAKAFQECFDYVDRIFIDKPASLAKEGVGSGLLYLTSWFDAIQSEYHKPDEEVWKMPLPQLFGRLKAIQQRNNPGEPEFNARQDALAAQIQRTLQRKELSQQEILSGKLRFN